MACVIVSSRYSGHGGYFERMDEARAKIQKGTNLEKKRTELEREITNLQEQLDELATILPPDDETVAARTERDAWRAGFAVTSISEPRPSLDGTLVKYTIDVVAHAGRRSWLGALDAIVHMPIVYDVREVRIEDPSNPDARIELVLTAYREPVELD